MDKWVIYPMTNYIHTILPDKATYCPLLLSVVCRPFSVVPYHLNIFNVFSESEFNRYWLIATMDEEFVIARCRTPWGLGGGGGAETIKYKDKLYGMYAVNHWFTRLPIRTFKKSSLMPEVRQSICKHDNKLRRDLYQNCKICEPRLRIKALWVWLS